jgi:hypothetical protein
MKTSTLLYLKNCLLGSLFLTTSVLAYPSVNASSDKLKKIELDLYGKRLSIDVPKQESKEFPQFPLIDFVDSNTEPALQETTGYQIVNKYWEFKKIMHPGSVGAMQMRVAVFALANPELEIAKADDLREIITQNAIRFYDASNKEKLEKGRPLLRVDLPQNFSIKHLGNLNWLEYGFENESGIAIYAIPLDKKHYIKIYFTYVNNSRGNLVEIKGLAENEIMEIMRSSTIK